MHYIFSKMKKLTIKQLIFWLVLAVCIVLSYLFINHNYTFYDSPIATVVSTNIDDTSEVIDMHGNKDHIYKQSIVAHVRNGKEKGNQIYLTNEFSASGAYDHEYRVGNDLFITIDKLEQVPVSSPLTGTIVDVKRDKYIVLVAWVFILTLLLIGRKQGFLSIVSLAVNSIVLFFALDLYLKVENINIIFVCIVCVILFTLISLLLVNGRNPKTYAAIAGTLLGTFLTLLISYLVLWVTSERGLYYEGMQFAALPYPILFMAGLFIGSLGAIMDVAITMTSSIFGLYEKNKNISIQAMKDSAMKIGKDIMGTMTNILFFVYVSGSIPMLILYLKNNTLFGYSLSINLSLELARALAGGIGIVITIPISLYISIFLINRKRLSS